MSGLLKQMLLYIALWSFAAMGMRYGYKRINRIELSTSLQASTTSISESNGLSKSKVDEIAAIGNTKDIPLSHPVVVKVIERWKQGSKPGFRSSQDKDKIALSIEGGGMRGCVAAGASAAINFLGLSDSVDVVYGSSAGAMVAAYFISRQYSGVQIYHDILPNAGTNFINKVKLLAAAGLPTWLVKLIIRQVHERNNKKKNSKNSHHNHHHIHMNHIPFLNKDTRISNDVFNLDYLLYQVMKGTQKLDWKTFQHNEQYQPLNIITCSTSTLQTVTLNRKKGNYVDILSLLACIRASMTVPGVTGPMMALPLTPTTTTTTTTTTTNKPSTNMHTVAMSNNNGNMHQSASSMNGQIKVSTCTSGNTSSSTDTNTANHTPYQSSSTTTILDQFLSIPYVLNTPTKSRYMKRLRQHHQSIINYDNIADTTLDNDHLPPIPISRRKQLLMKIRKRFQRFTLKNRIRITYFFHNRMRNRMSANRPYDRQALYMSRVNTNEYDYRVNIPTLAPTASTTSGTIGVSGGSQSTQNPSIDTQGNTGKTSNINIGSKYDGLVDACVSEPIPYRSAVTDGATHIIVLRTKPDPCIMKKKPAGVFEKLIAKRFFKRYNEYDAVKWMLNMEHIKIYTDDILLLNEATKGHPHGVLVDDKSVHILPIAPQCEKEVDQLELNRATVLDGMREGALRVFEVFMPHMNIPNEYTPLDLVDLIFPYSILNSTINTQLQMDSTTYGIPLHI